MDKFLDTYNQPKLNKEDINYLNRPFTSNEIQAVIKSLLTNKSPGPDGFMENFTKTLKKVFNPSVLTNTTKSFPGTKKERTTTKHIL
jgi:hypothetical protein